MPYESYSAVELGVLGLVDDTHAAFAKLPENPVVGDSFTYHGEVSPRLPAQRACFS